MAARAAANIEHLIGALRSRSNAHLILNTLEMRPSQTRASWTASDNRPIEAIRTVNRRSGKRPPGTGEFTYLITTL